MAENPGSTPLHVFESMGRLWIGDEEAPLELLPPDLDIEPGGSVDFFEFQLVDDEPLLVVSGEVGLRGAWARELWFEYRPGQSSAAVLRREAWEVGPDEDACDLTATPRPW